MAPAELKSRTDGNGSLVGRTGESGVACPSIQQFPHSSVGLLLPKAEVVTEASTPHPCKGPCVGLRYMANCSVVHAPLHEPTIRFVEP